MATYAIYDFIEDYQFDNTLPFWIDPKKIVGVSQSGNTFSVGSVDIAEKASTGWQYYFDDATLDTTIVPFGGEATTTASLPPMVFSTLPDQNVNDVGNVNFNTPTRMDTGWSHSTNEFTYTGSPDRVRIGLMVSIAIGSADNIQRPAPVIELYKNNVRVASARTYYIRDNTGHEESSGTIYYLDPNPGTNPVYDVRSRRDSTRTNAVNSDLGHFTGEALL